jgi:hypothetical protein
MARRAAGPGGDPRGKHGEALLSPAAGLTPPTVPYLARWLV